jgi:hypothetical protein
MADAWCRSAVFDYVYNPSPHGLALNFLADGVECNTEDADCAASNLEHAGELSAQLAACAFSHDGCRTECRGASLGSVCDWFCQCMPTTCPESFPVNGWGEQGGHGGAGTTKYLSDYYDAGDTDEERCRAYCEDLVDDPERFCRLEHCDFAQIESRDRELHCNHADGTADCNQ